MKPALKRSVHAVAWASWNSPAADPERSRCETRTETLGPRGRVGILEQPRRRPPRGPAVKPALKRSVHAVAWALGALTSGSRVLPSFLIVGAQRCGTTSLYRALSQHPLALKPVLRKGVHYFDTAYDRGPSWYRAHFPLGGRPPRRHAGTVAGPRHSSRRPTTCSIPWPVPDRPRPTGRQADRAGPRPRRAGLLRARPRAGQGVRDGALLRQGRETGGGTAGRGGGSPARLAVLDEPGPPAPRLPGQGPLRRAARPA